MSNITPVVIQSLLDELAALERQLKEGGNMKTARLYQQRIDAVRVAVTGGAAFNEGSWSQLSADRQKDLLDSLEKLRDGLRAESKIGDTRHLSGARPEEAPSRQLLVWIALCGFIFAATLFSLVR